MDTVPWWVKQQQKALRVNQEAVAKGLRPDDYNVPAIESYGVNDPKYYEKSDDIKEEQRENERLRRVASEEGF